jgi:MFS family permease
VATVAAQGWKARQVAKIYYGWVLVATLGITETISWGIVYYGFSAFLPVVEREQGWSRGEMSGAFALAVLLSGLFAAPVGRWLDRRGPRLLMTAGSIAAVILLLALSRVSDLPQFYAVWALLGITMSAILYEPAFAVVTAWFERRRTAAITAVTLMAGLASTIFIPLEVWLIEQQGWRSALVSLAAFLALSTVLPHALLLRRRPEDLGLHVDGALAPMRHGPLARSASISVGQAIRESSFRWLTIAFSTTSLVSYGVHVHLLAYLVDHGSSPAFAAVATGMVGAMQVLGRIMLGLVGDRLPLRVSTALVLGIQPLSLLFLLLLPGAVGIWGFIAIFGAAKGAMTLVRPAYVAHLYGRERYASIAGVLAAFVTVANGLAPFGIGAAHDLLGSYEPLFWAFVGLSVVPCGAILLVRRTPIATAP